MNDTWTDLVPGDSVYSPRGSVHGFKNHTDQPIRVLTNIAPAGFERFFAEVAEEFVEPEPDLSRIPTIEEKYGLHSV
jgi:oxalate decarboxylase/phosphoglucose isomerase-like protein (cupin superfamily)